jgi:hypothetical protein
VGFAGWLDPRSGGVAGRIGRAVVGWAPIALGIGWLVGEVSGCARYVAECDPAATPFAWVVMLAALGILLVVPLLASLTTIATLVTLLAAVPSAVFLSATRTPGAAAAAATLLGILLVVAWCIGIGIGVWREIRPEIRPRGPVS